ncbi:MAG: 2-hydroxyacyl-CoA dehydratase subunit D [Candidatus Heimdallarchaeota archaeon]
MLRKKIHAVKELNKIMSEYYHDLDRASRTNDKKIAWCSSVGPAEILRSLDFKVYFPENHSAMLGASRMATDLIPYANAIGYSPEICSYLTADIGAYLKKETALTKAYSDIKSVPKPDVLVYNTNQCREVQDWFNWFANEFKAPLLGISTPRTVGKVTRAHVNFIGQQMEQLIQQLEDISMIDFELKKLKDVVLLSRECSELWKKILDTAATIPSPFTFFDGTIHMSPAVVLRGTSQAVEYYKILLVELQQRVKDHIGAVENERYRLYWEGMPIWGRLKHYSELFASLNTCIVASTYCNSWIFTAFNENDPIRSMAKAYTELFIVRSDEYKEIYLNKMINLFKADGIIFHDARTCPHNTNSRYGMPQRIELQARIPSLILNGDLNDLRCLSDEQSKTSIEAFIEQLEELKE